MPRKATHVGESNRNGLDTRERSDQPHDESRRSEDKVGGLELLHLLLETTVLLGEFTPYDPAEKVAHRASKNDEDQDDEFLREARLSWPIGESCDR